ncbi:MAG: phage tail assembly protein [Methylococcaceae bacterium]|nr:phage tail assembly protein [Methylococcaceae bacterium]
MTLQTEFNFSLPRGYVDSEGNLHKSGIMRMATALDEIAPMKDPRVQSNPAYLAVILLSRVIIQLGDLQQVNPKVIENLFSADFAFLEDMYRRINDQGNNNIEVTCPNCESQFAVELGSGLGEQ